MRNGAKDESQAAALAMALLLLPVPAAFLKFAGQQKALAGLKGVSVEVTPLMPEAERTA